MGPDCPQTSGGPEDPPVVRRFVGCPAPHQNLVGAETAAEPAYIEIMRLFIFMVLHCNGVAMVYLFILNEDVIIHQIATLFKPAPPNKLLIYSNRCPTSHRLIKFMRLPGVT